MIAVLLLFTVCVQILKASASLQGGISNILEEMVVQPLLVSVSALTLATETVRSILKIDDVVSKQMGQSKRST